MDIEEWFQEKQLDIGEPENGFHAHVIDVDDLRNLLKNYALVPRVPSEDFCKKVYKQSCRYVSDTHTKAMLRFIINASENK